MNLWNVHRWAGVYAKRSTATNTAKWVPGTIKYQTEGSKDTGKPSGLKPFYIWYVVFCTNEHQSMIKDEHISIKRRRVVHSTSFYTIPTTIICLIRKSRHYGYFRITKTPKQNGRHFSDVIFRCIFFDENWCIWIEIMFSRVQLTIIQHWFRKWLGPQATDHYLNQWWASLFTRIWLCRSQLVKNKHHYYLTGAL